MLTLNICKIVIGYYWLHYEYWWERMNELALTSKKKKKKKTQQVLSFEKHQGIYYLKDPCVEFNGIRLFFFCVCVNV